MTDTYTIRLPWPDQVLSGHAKGGWRPKAEATKAARHMAKAICLEKPRIESIPDAHIMIEYYPKTYGRDIQNTPAMLKAYIDGIADAMGCDDRGFRVSYPDQWAGKTKNGEIVFRIMRPLEACGIEVKENK